VNCIYTLWGENADVSAVKEVVNKITIVPLLLISVYTGTGEQKTSHSMCNGGRLAVGKAAGA
jgi:hypothetical protein